MKTKKKAKQKRRARTNRKAAFSGTPHHFYFEGCCYSTTRMTAKARKRRSQRAASTCEAVCGLSL